MYNSPSKSDQKLTHTFGINGQKSKGKIVNKQLNYYFNCIKVVEWVALWPHSKNRKAGIWFVYPSQPQSVDEMVNVGSKDYQTHM